MDDQIDVKTQQENKSTTRKLLRDVLVFQCKLAMDGLRDLILSPVSIILALYGTITNPSNPAIYFQSLLKFGRKSDDFINLFNHNTASDKTATPTSDDYVEQIETLVTERMKKHENTFNTKDYGNTKTPSDTNNPN
ncbi:hypothetical protein EYS14_09610 [Alteromonadaceae bacterium M269]|nr:hypothetical protein EYS14_09610 [Alteromonadaceae bacterium M269]